MVQEQEFFLSSLRDFCNTRLSLKPSFELDYDILYKVAEKQDLAAVIYQQCFDWLKNNRKFQDAFLNTAAVSVNRKYLLKEVAEKFEEQNIPIICMKAAYIVITGL